MEKCLMSLHSGVFIYGNDKQDTKQNNLIKERCNFKIVSLDFPKDNFKDTMNYLEKQLKIYAKKYKIYLLGRSSGGYLAKQLFNRYSNIIEKVVYLSPCFNPKKRQQIIPEFKNIQDYYFRHSQPIPETNQYEQNKELIFLAKEDNHIPIECFTKKQKQNIHFFNKTHKGLVFSTNTILIDIICNFLLST